jgi:hypothetical protein
MFDATFTVDKSCDISHIHFIDEDREVGAMGFPVRMGLLFPSGHPILGSSLTHLTCPFSQSLNSGGLDSIKKLCFSELSLW